VVTVLGRARLSETREINSIEDSVLGRSIGINHPFLTSANPLLTPAGQCKFTNFTLGKARVEPEETPLSQSRRNSHCTDIWQCTLAFDLRHAELISLYLIGTLVLSTKLMVFIAGSI
jgi:hypothetical protein